MTRPGKRGVLMMLILGGAYFFSNFHRLALAVLSETISAEMQLTSMQIGTLGSAIFYSYALMQIPCGFFADRISARKIITVACILTAGSTVLFAVSSSFPLMVAARVLTGAATALIYVPALSAIRNHFGDSSFGSMTGIMVAMGQMGSVCASTPLKILSDVLGWQITFIAIGIVTLLLALGAWLLILDTQPAPAAPSMATKNAERRGIRIPMIGWAIVIWFFITAGTRLSFQSLWGNLFFTEGRLYSSSSSSVFLMCMSIGCILGSVLLGKLCDVIGNIRTLIIGTVVLALGWEALACIPLGGTVWTVCSMLSCVVIGAAGAGTFTAGFSSIRLYSSKEKTGILTGINNSAAFIGSAVFTQFAGEYANMLPVEGIQAQYTGLMTTFFVICLAAALLVWSVDRHNTKGECSAKTGV